MYYKIPFFSFLCTAVLLLSACQQANISQQVLSDEKIARIMVDMATVDAAINLLTGYARDSTAQVYYAQVFEMNGTTLEIYEASLRTLAQDIPHIEAIHAQAEELMKARLPKPAVVDSTQKK
jgi:Domain of unknown function (DUF4296)